MKISDLIDALETLDDRDLRTLEIAVKVRRRRSATLKAAAFAVGEEVRFVDETRPQLLAGALAKVVGYRREKVVVDLVVPVGRWSRGVRVPPSLLRRAS